MTEKRFSIRLANGSEQTFDSASQLASWTRSQYALQRNLNPARKQKHRRRQKQHLQSDAYHDGNSDGGLPLARFNRRQRDDGGNNK